MKPNISPLERAFDLARTGEYRNVTEIKRVLVAEGYTIHQITGPTLVRQLNDICAGRTPTRKAAAPHRQESRLSTLLRD